MLWTEKYYPRQASDFQIHAKIVEKFKQLSSASDLPHLIFCGKRGSGKTALVRQLLRMVFGPDADQVQSITTNKELKTSGTRNVNLDVHVLRSPFHVELNPSDYGRNDVHVVQDEMKTLSDGYLGQSIMVLVLNEVELMSKAAQHALRRTMEKASTRCRLIMCCSNLSHVIDPIKSRCCVIRVPCPTQVELHSWFHEISKSEHFNLRENVVVEIAEKCDYSMRSCLLCLQTCHAKGLFIGLDDQISIPEWKLAIIAMVDNIQKHQTAKMILETRKILYDLLASCIPPTEILMTVVEEILPVVETEHQHRLIELAAHYDQEIRNGGKAIFHLEAFVVSWMSVIVDLKNQ